MAKKPGYFTVRLTVSVYHPPYGQLFVIFWGCSFDLISCLYVFWNEFYTRKVIFIQLQEFPTPPYCRCCSVTKRSDSGIAEALKALKMHFWDPSQWDKMCFEYHRVIFYWKKCVKIFTFAYGQGRGGWPPAPPPTPYSLAVKCFFVTSLTKSVKISKFAI